MASSEEKAPNEPSTVCQPNALPGIASQAVSQSDRGRTKSTTKIICTCDGAVIATDSRRLRAISTATTVVPEERDYGETGLVPFEVHWDGLTNPRNPRNMHTARKWVIILVLSSVSLCSHVSP